MATEPMGIWPDNVAAFNLFTAVATQWRIGSCGPTGLDYSVLYRRMDRMKLDDEAFAQLEQDIQTMESAALAEMGRPKD